MKIIDVVDDELGNILGDHKVGFGDFLLLVNASGTAEYLVLVCQISANKIGLISLDDDKDVNGGVFGIRHDANRMCDHWTRSNDSEYNNFNSEDLELISTLNCKHTHIPYKVYKVNVEICVYRPTILESNRII